MTKYTFSNREYLLSHGKAPRGTGHWAFIVDGAVEDIAPEAYVDVYRMKSFTTFWVPGVWTLTEAKRRAAVMLAANAIPATTIYVAP